MRTELGHFLANGDKAGLFLDYDGTLADIVAVPERAYPHAGTPEVLARLARRLKVVAVVSGRSAAQLVEWLGPEIEIWGLHGAERAHAGTIEVAPTVQGHVHAVSEARAALTDALSDSSLEGVTLEDKTAIVALHYRNTPDVEAARARVIELARGVAGAHGLTIAEGRKVVELRPPVAFSKADVLVRRTREENLRAVAFAGDDLVDLPAFDALDALAKEGRATLRVGVASDETPRELLARSDLVVAGRSGLRALLEELAREPG